MKYLGLLILTPFLLFANSNTEKLLWGATGHRVVGEVATQHLSKRTARKIKKLLRGQSLAYVSNYADDIKSDSQYRSYSPWHYANLGLDETYEASSKNAKGDVVTAIQKCIAVLKDKEETNENKAFHLKLLVHFVGDIHQPMHLGRLEDKGGNDIEVKWFGKRSNLHRVWDSDVINSHQMSYMEMASNLPVLSKVQKRSIKEAPLKVWIEESHTLAKKIYTTLPEKKNLGYRYRYEYLDSLRMQLLKGGLRLAFILNEVFK